MINRLYYKSDFKSEVTLPSSIVGRPFRFTYTTSGARSLELKRFVAYRDADGHCENCTVVPREVMQPDGTMITEERVVVNFDNHGLRPGTLRTERKYFLADEGFTLEGFNPAKLRELDLELTTHADDTLDLMLIEQEPKDEELLMVLRGKSAYEVAVANGFVGTEQEWLDAGFGVDVMRQANEIAAQNVENVMVAGQTAKTQALEAIDQKANECITTLNETKDEAETAINETKDAAETSINEAKDAAISAVTEAKEQAEATINEARQAIAENTEAILTARDDAQTAAANADASATASAESAAASASSAESASTSATESAESATASAASADSAQHSAESASSSLSEVQAERSAINEALGQAASSGESAAIAAVAAKTEQNKESINDLALKVDELEEKSGDDFHQEVNEDGFFLTDSQRRIGMKYTKEEGLDVAKLSEHFKSLVGVPNADELEDYGYTDLVKAVKHLLSVDKINQDLYIPEDYSELEQSLISDALTRVNAIDPERKMMAFAVISDLHQTTKDGNYTGSGAAEKIECEPSLRVLGAVADMCKLDAVVCVGDLSTGLRNDATFEQYKNIMEKVRGFFKRYVHVPAYVAMGNHDYHPSTNDYMPLEYWKEYLKRFCWNTANVNVHFIDKEDGFDSHGNRLVDCTYYVDFEDKKFRMMLPCTWQGSNDEHFNFDDIYDMLQPCDDKLAEYTMCYFNHDANAFEDGRFSKAFLDGTTLGAGAGTGHKTYSFKQGFAHIGAIGGHLHQSKRGIWKGDARLNEIRVSMAGYNSNKSLTINGYCFSVFIYDRETFKLTELKVGRLESADVDADGQPCDTFVYNVSHN